MNFYKSIPFVWLEIKYYEFYLTEYQLSCLLGKKAHRFLTCEKMLFELWWQKYMLENASECQFDAKKHIWGNDDLEVTLIEKIEMIMIWHIWSKENEALLENDWNEYKWWFIWSREEEVLICGRFCLNQFSCFLLSCCTELPPSISYFYRHHHHYHHHRHHHHQH